MDEFKFTKGAKATAIKVRKIGYKGMKRYVRITAGPTPQERQDRAAAMELFEFAREIFMRPPAKSPSQAFIDSLEILKKPLLTPPKKARKRGNK